jgi:hypothetical protein
MILRSGVLPLAAPGVTEITPLTGLSCLAIVYIIVSSTHLSDEPYFSIFLSDIILITA